jgi:KUP system potassium uptake protein
MRQDLREEQPIARTRYGEGDKGTEQALPSEPGAAVEQPHHHPHAEPQGGYLALLALSALGVVYGDIGTSPLYALRESFHGPHGIAPTPLNIMGVLSLIFWSLVIVISIKYLAFVLRADNQGEGGILALTALATPIKPLGASEQRWIVLLGVFGAALLYGDGIITPAISVLSAVEGLKVATPLFEPYVVPLTVVILVALFLIQRSGTGTVGRMFGPIMLIWFSVLGLLGIAEVVKNPSVLAALNPAYALTFFLADGLTAFLVLGTVFLVVTGGEALYADMGHFGRKPIRLAWFSLVLPALLLNYFGQGALLLAEPEAASNPFYRLAPEWALYPMVVLATLATVIASQALISGAFSITKQAIQLGFLPRQRIFHTSSTQYGQIYIPGINWLLMVACILVVIGFQTSSNLAAAYGIAVTSTMAITTLIFYVVTRDRWHWSAPLSIGLCGFFMVIDIAFLGANLVKIPQGGWFPLVVAVAIFTLMTTWKKGRRLVAEREEQENVDLGGVLNACRMHKVTRVPGTAVFLSALPYGAPSALLANVKYNHTAHEHTVLVTVDTRSVPFVDETERYQVDVLGQGFYQVRLFFGFMEEPDVPRALAQVFLPGMTLELDQVVYFVNRTRVLPSNHPGMQLWREHLYSVMARNAASPTDYFNLPPAQVVEIGTSIEV